MEKIEKQKQKQKQNKNDQIDILRLKQSFFSETACNPLCLFLKFGTPPPDSVERLQKQAGSLSGFTGFVWTKG